MHEPLPLTELANPRSAGIDRASREQILESINAEDATVAAAVGEQIPRIARALEALEECWNSGGSIFYCGAGTSGRLGILDAAECPPTFGTAPERVQAIIAGGRDAMVRSIEGAEDSRAAGRRDLQGRGFAAGDALVGIAASGRTPYVLGAVDHANAIGAASIGISCNPGSQLELAARHPITPAVGPEIVTGSTRMKSGTAQKLVLNMLSTGLMIRTGCVLGNLMVNVQVRNEKLARRAERIIRTVCDCDAAQAAATLETAGQNVRLAILMIKSGLPKREATELLASCGDNLRRALERDNVCNADSETC